MTNVWKKVGSRLPWVAALAVLSLSSCKKDPCKDVSCQNGGVCVDGNCSCPTAWEGSRCEVDVRDKFIGAWSGSIDCGSGLGNATIRIGKLSGKDGRIAIEGTTIHGRVTSSTEFEIPLQNYLVPDSSAVYVISGRGVLEGRNLNVTILYTVPSGPGFFCTFRLQRNQ